MALPQHVNKQYKTRLLLFLDYSRMEFENQHICRCLFVLQVVIGIYSNQTSQELSVTTMILMNHCIQSGLFCNYKRAQIVAVFR